MKTVSSTGLRSCTVFKHLLLSKIRNCILVFVQTFENITTVFVKKTAYAFLYFGQARKVIESVYNAIQRRNANALVTHNGTGLNLFFLYSGSVRCGTLIQNKR